jgi:hypothetical protein
MIPLWVWLRKRRLERALREYPLYDPPHKVEERLLSREKAAENFDYFMRVRLQRVAYFRQWLRRHFGVAVTLDEKGVRALSHWGNQYAGLLRTKGPDGRLTKSYFTYDPPWTGENVGCNVVFDMGITLGEAVIANCPKLRWDFDPISAILPNEAKVLKRTSGMSFQRPRLTGFDNPAYGIAPLHEVNTFAISMMQYTTTVEGMKRFRKIHRFDRRLIDEQLINAFTQTLKDYPEGDPVGLRREMGTEEYLKLVDSESAESNQDGSDE